MEKYTLDRTGQPPLTFEGALVKEADSKWCNGQEKNRWHTIAVYRTKGGKFVVAIGYRTCWQGELDDDCAEVIDSPEGVADTLRDYDPTAHVQGFPAGGAYADRQAKLLQDIVHRFASLVSEVLAGEEFAEVVE